MAIILNTDNNCKLLAEKIADTIRQGIKLGPDTLHYIDSTFSNPTTEELAQIIRDESNCERDCLIDLIFFPDESFQVVLEEMLECYHFDKNEEQTLRDYLSSARLETTLYFPDDRKPLKLQMPLSVIGQFISRLHISRRLDPKLLNSINENVSANHRTLVKIKLRNTTRVPTGNKIDFLSVFFKKLDANDSQFLECLEFVLYILSDLSQDAEIFSALKERKRLYFKILKKAEKFEEALKKNNVETLLLQGNRMPYINRSEAIEKMRLIDKISLAVFGRIVFLEQSSGSINLGVYNRDKDLKKIVKLLT